MRENDPQLAAAGRPKNECYPSELGIGNTV